MVQMYLFGYIGRGMGDVAARVVGDLIAELHADPDAANYPSAVLRHLRRVIGFESAAFMPRGPALPGTFGKSGDFQPIYRHFRSHQQRFEADMVRGWAQAAREGAYVDTDLYSFEERRRLGFFREILQPQGITSRIVAHVMIRGETQSTIHLCRHDSGRHFRADDLSLVQRVLPAIAVGQAALQCLSAQPFAPGHRLAHLTLRERQIVESVRLGHQNKEIAQILGISPNTVRNQLSEIFRRLNVSGRTQLAALAAEDGRSDETPG